MKKTLLYFSFAVVMALLTAGNSFAQAVYSRGPDARMKTEGISGTTAPTLSTNITTNNRLIGYEFSDSAAGNTALFDVAAAQSASGSTTLAPSTSNVFSEVDVIAGGNIVKVFPLPRNIVNGLVTKNSATTGKLVVYYE